MPNRTGIALGIAALCCFAAAWMTANGPIHRPIFLLGCYTALGIGSCIVNIFASTKKVSI